MDPKLRRLQIEGLAAPLFAERGFQGVTMRDISEAAATPLGTLTWLYADKQELYDRILVDAVERFVSLGVQALDGGGTAIERFGRFVDITMAAIGETGSFARILGREVVSGADTRLATLSKEPFERLGRSLMPIFQEFRGPMDREQQERLVALTINFIFCACSTSGQQHVMFGHEVLDPASLSREFQDLLLHGLLSPRRG